jgi:magnesium transporter
MGKNKLRTRTSKHEIFSSAGTPNYIGKPISGEAQLRLIQYNASAVLITQDPPLEKMVHHMDKSYNNWVDLEGIHNSVMVERIAKIYDLHPLLLEDILNTTQKAKLEYLETNDIYSAILKVPRRLSPGSEIEFEHVTLVLSRKIAITFQEKDNTDVFGPILERMNRVNSKTKKNGLDYLFYSFLDIIVDYYYLALNQTEEIMEVLEDELLAQAKPEHQNRLFYLKREISQIRKALFPMRDIISQVIKDENDFIKTDTKIYLKDVLDHVNENLESIETYKDEIENLLTHYHSQLSNRMNSVMKTLTVFTAIFMPLTFIAGIYGMNFDNMPELRHNHGYYYTLIGMVTLSVSQWIYFRWKKYI